MKKQASVLERLSPEEAQAVLERLLAAHPRLRRVAQRLAKSLLSEVRFESVAAEVDEALRNMDMEEFGCRAGKHSWGYTEPSEAAWELLGERLSPFTEDIKRRLEMGLIDEALESCKGVVLGLYRLLDVQGGAVLQWAPDFPAEAAAHAVDTWREGGENETAGANQRDLRVFPPDFVKDFVPEWEDLIDRG